jgi:hypothetical protein
MNVDDHKKIVAWLKEIVGKIKTGQHKNEPEVIERIKKFEQVIGREEAIIAALESKPDFVD